MADMTTVSPMDRALKNPPILEGNEDESTVILDSASSQCLWNGQAFADGAKLESDGVIFECSYGRSVKS